jgi:hypothetical protein
MNFSMCFDLRTAFISAKSGFDQLRGWAGRPLKVGPSDWKLTQPVQHWIVLLRYCVMAKVTYLLSWMTFNETGSKQKLPLHKVLIIGIDERNFPMLSSNALGNWGTRFSKLGRPFMLTFL